MWHAQTYDGYSYDSDEAYDNAMEIFRNMYNEYGWSRNAVIGMLGNSGAEGGFNPWRWESDVVLSTSDWRYWTATSRGGNSSADYYAKDSRGIFISPMRHGGGLWGFTPYDKYLTLYEDVMNHPDYAPNFSDRAGMPEDGNAQCYYLATHGEWVGSRIPSQYPQVSSMQEYSQLTYDSDTMTAIWLYGYEGSGDPEGSLPTRRMISRYFDENLPDKPGGLPRKVKRVLLCRPKYPWWIK